ncbi:XRE family transcriptional regulator [Amycolatopsis methanolica 239]|uniref:XRE family transcriptional regulator n=1 Tax=Amycolatopsis methanolica 239 TaxID=1068978 RepID=A0A076MXW5_AMYME|nr:XRE family transcriptional regulator [Amycolatopsis methanolica 239]
MVPTLAVDGAEDQATLDLGLVVPGNAPADRDTGDVDGADLGAFLKARLAALDPRDVGLPPQGVTRRQVAGLRREELAQLAGISVDYLTRLEHGRARNVSGRGARFARQALRLNPDEGAYLHNLASPRRKRTGGGARLRLRPLPRRAGVEPDGRRDRVRLRLAATGRAQPAEAVLPERGRGTRAAPRV